MHTTKYKIVKKGKKRKVIISDSIIRSSEYVIIADTLRPVKITFDEADFYIQVNDKWCMVDINIPLESRYNVMWIDAQLKGFNNVAEAMWNDASYYSKWIRKSLSSVNELMTF